MLSPRRRKAFAVTVATGIMISVNFAAVAQNLSNVEVWKSPYCGCCAKWIDMMKGAGFQVRIHNTESLKAIKRKHGVPGKLRSCHTATVGGYVVEGHVPIADVQRLLNQKPNVVGISVPGMPIGSPGMEVASGETEPYEVLTFDKDGRTSVFAKHK